MGVPLTLARQHGRAVAREARFDIRGGHAFARVASLTDMTSAVSAGPAFEFSLSQGRGRVKGRLIKRQPAVLKFDHRVHATVLVDVRVARHRCGQPAGQRPGRLAAAEERAGEHKQLAPQLFKDRPIELYSIATARI